MRFAKIVIFYISIILLFQIWFAFDFTLNCEKKTFVVTAYYSPKSWQAFYYKGNFDDEKVLNWNWINWASWKPVFNWMLAAPSEYNFGWLIYFPSLWWVWEISDRWWAIVQAWEKWQTYDRIDVRMWTWELWLVRALTFWKQTIVGYYCDNNKVKELWIKEKVWFNFDSIRIEKYFFNSTLFLQDLRLWRNDVRVYELQDYLSKFGYMDKKTGYFGDETKNALCKYQVKRWISSWKYCGNFSERTRSYMKNEAKIKWLLPDYTINTTIDDLIYYSKNFQFKPSWSDNPKSINKMESDDINHNYFTEAYKKWTQNGKIWDLQDMLRHYGFYKGDINGTYDKETINAVLDFQITAWILKRNDQSSARWWMGPATRNALNIRWVRFQEFKSTN